ncbi:DUF6734 family protein [Salegentibacter sp. UBA1130]|uniref:DUF6734 family protein n=1 Tax=Salegentibacter sp. UBA1130 TaxID=1947451 RepID=UPI0025811A9D|nr:DUF6734 family protein [Salegentibacter sp. UBA1130]
MKIVQSYWSKPTLKKDSFKTSDRNKGGWVDKRFNYMSWALSCLQFKKFYSKVELVTDQAGYDLLINKLDLPYTHVDVCLDRLNIYHSDLWALGKIYAYSIQKEPFIHADGDIYIYHKFKPESENADLFVQNIEDGFSYYDNIFKQIRETFQYIPPELLESIEKNKKIISVNAGLLGGNDIAFFNCYTKEVFNFVDQNLAKIDKIDKGMFNTIFEQFLFMALAEKRDKKVSYQLKEVNHAFDGLADFTGLPNRTKYIHTVGIYKKINYIGNLLEHRLMMDYPDYYFKILNLLKTNQI